MDTLLACYNLIQINFVFTGLGGNPRINFQLLGGPKLYVDDVEQVNSKMEVVDHRFKRSEGN